MDNEIKKKKFARKNTKNFSEQTFDDVRAYHYFIILYFQTYGKNTVHLLLI